jgi:hypothetical protein
VFSHGVQTGGGDKFSADHDERSLHRLPRDFALARDDLRATAGGCSLHDFSAGDHDGSDAGGAGLPLLGVCNGRMCGADDVVFRPSRSHRSGAELRLWCDGCDSRVLCSDGAGLRRNDNELCSAIDLGRLDL